MKKTGFIYSPDFLKHETGEHPENPSRLLSIISYLKEKKIFENLIHISPVEATVDELLLIHDEYHICKIKKYCDIGEKCIDADTFISPYSYRAALLSAGGVIKAINKVLSGDIHNAFCAVRPPGHHAEKNMAMGFCIFNNAAIGARYAVQKKGVKKIFIIDWDVHHGNGTQNAFYDNQQVFYVSLHQHPHYPGTGLREETGTGKGKGFTSNFPMQAGSGDKEYISLLKQKICPAIIDYQPELILISAGFDAHKDDPLASICLTSRGFRNMTELLLEAASKVCRGRIVSILEGGYDLSALGESVGYHISALLDGDK